MFNEKNEEFSTKQGKKIPVWQSPKYAESRAKAIEIIDSKKYGLTEGDFWILMNETKSGKMGYTGLILSHNGCLKINDNLPAEKKYKPECVTINESGWGGSLVFIYCCPEQGLFETGEVSTKNCKNDYPYAMAEKRLIDRVVLKNSKLAFSGIYGEAEADEFRDPLDDTVPKRETIEDVQRRFEAPVKQVCEDCGKVIVSYKGANGKPVDVDKHIKATRERYGKSLCIDCAMKRRAEESNADAES